MNLGYTPKNTWDTTYAILSEPFDPASELGVIVVGTLILVVSGIYMQKKGKSYLEWILSITPISLVLITAICCIFLVIEIIKANYIPEIWGWRTFFVIPIFIVKSSIALIILHPLFYGIYRYIHRED